ncbi:MAG: hypothetical protein IT250_06005 [Chitinophagaceae bacterium]|nr:hypothetical protein [Chitinophagaceae bacterium]
MKPGVVFIMGLLFTTLSLRAKTGDTLRVVSHNQTVVVTDPATGVKAYRQWTVFPSAKLPVRRVNLIVTFGCPDSLRCADWDYMDHIYIRRKGGMNNRSMDYPIGRMLTPYGGAFGKNWNFEWKSDITDFGSLLRDSVEIEYEHTGYEPNNDRGWKITVAFEIIMGKPVLEPVSIQKLYDGSFAYGDSKQPIEEQLKPVSFVAENEAQHARIVIFQTGHGMDRNGCGEFCSRYRELWFDGKMIDRRDIWKKCGDNPLYPQAGTWPIDRASWCPGYLQQPDVFDLPVTNGTEHTVDINMEPYQTDNPSANERITAYLIQYKKPVAKYDIAVEDIVVPSNTDIHLRKNPSCAHPKIVIRNLGSEPLTQCVITYGTIGFERKKQVWTGNLQFNQQVEVELPGEIAGNNGENRFVASVSSPNGRKDAYAFDNEMQSIFTKAPVHSGELVFYLRTNKQPQHNAYQVYNSDGSVIFERGTGTMKAETDYRDSLHLTPGCYVLQLKDTAGDGLEFWFNNRGGRGLARLMDSKGQLLKHFDSDFGNEIYYSFEVSADSGRFSPPDPLPAVGLFPTRTNGKTSLDYFANRPQHVTVQLVTDPGSEVVETHEYEMLKEGIFTYDLSYRPPQRYYVKVYVGGKLVFNKRLRVGG